MKQTARAICLLTAGLLFGTAMAGAPSYLTTVNKTNVESNAYIDGTIPSPYPTHPNSTNQLLWGMVKMACLGHIHNDKCRALIFMDTKSNKPVKLGWVSMNLTNGHISKEFKDNNGYKLTVNGPGKVTLDYDSKK